MKESESTFEGSRSVLTYKGWKPWFALLLVATVFYFVDGWLHTRNLREIPRNRGELSVGQKELKVALVCDHGLPMTGKMFEKGAQIAVDEINQKELEIGGEKYSLKLEVHKYNSPKESNEVATEKICKDPSYIAVAGHMDSNAALAASLFYEQSGLLFLSPFATSSSLTNHKFRRLVRTVPSNAHYARRLGQAIVDILGDTERSTYRVGLLFNRSSKAYTDQANLLSRFIIRYNSRCAFLNELGEDIQSGVYSSEMSLVDYVKKQYSSNYKLALRWIILESFNPQKALVLDWTLEELVKENIIDSEATLDDVLSHYPDRKEIELIFTDSYDADAGDFTEMIAENAERRNDLLILCDYLDAHSARLIKQLRLQGLNQPILTGDGFDVSVKEVSKSLAGAAGPDRWSLHRFGL